MRTIRTVLAVIGVVVALLVIVSLLSTGTVFFEAFRARVVAGPEVTKKVYDPNNIIGQVAFFTQTCEDVGKDYANWHNNQNAYEQAIALGRSVRTSAEAAQAQSRSEQLSAYVQGAVGQLNQDAANYNARSINYTANPFKSAGLPYRIEVPSGPELSTWRSPSCG